MPAPDAALNVMRIQPAKGWAKLQFKELWEFRELFYFLTLRDISVRYKQTLLGAAWAIIQPVFTMLVFSVFFGRLAKVPSDGVPYPVFAFAALVPWIFFSNSLTQSSNSLVQSANLIRKVYFPRIIVPVSSILAGLVDFAVSFVVLLGLMFWYGLNPTLNIIWLPLLILLALVTALGVGVWLAALNVEYRDIRYVVPFLTQFWMLATPVGYPGSLVSEEWRLIYGLNPMVGVVEGFRWALLNTNTAPGPMIAASTVAALLVLGSGLIYFRQMERNFADVV